MATYKWSIPTGNIITGSTYIKDTDNKIQDTMGDLANFVNSEGAYAGQGLMFDYVNKDNAQTITGVKTFSNGLIGNVTGNSGTATKLATARTITLTGDVNGSVSFDGSANASITTTVGDDSHSHSIAYIAGLQTALDGKLSTSGNAASATNASYANNAGYATSAGYANNAGYAATQAYGTNNTTIATTAFVQANNGVIASSKAATGYIKFGNGLIIQWGSSTGSRAGYAVAFPLAFTTQCYIVLACSNDSTAYYDTRTYGYTTTTFAISNPGGTGAANHVWFAIGE